MALSQETARQIVAAVKRDSACQLQINSWLRRLPAGWGVNGTLRNLGRFVTLQDASEERIAREACTGIAIATVNAIEHELAASPGIPEVASVDTIHRYSPNHTATQISMRDGTSYVFDWHATLNVR